MIIINFSHPLTTPQEQKIEELTQAPIQGNIDVSVKMDNNLPFKEQIVEIVNRTGLSSFDWQTKPILVNPPAYAPASAVLLAELHGRMGYFPTIIRIQPVPNSIPPTFEVAEIINLQGVRAEARTLRGR